MIEAIKFMLENNVKSVLDIGANVGSFSEGVKASIPDANIFMIEANPFCEDFLLRTEIPYTIACLSNIEKFAKLHVNRMNNVCTGVSLYKENTPHYGDATFVNVNTRLLDDVIIGKFGDIKEFEYIKMDTQGSELDIILGGMKTIKKAKYIQIELSLIQYNDGAPLKERVVDFLQNIGFNPRALVEKHYWNQNPSEQLIQEDWIFSK